MTGNNEDTFKNDYFIDFRPMANITILSARRLEQLE